MAGRTRVSIHFKMAVRVLSALTAVFFVANILLVILLRDPTPSQASLIVDTGRSWQTLLAAIIGFFGGKAL